MFLVQRPTNASSDDPKTKTQGWYLVYDNGLMIEANDNVQSVEKAAPRIGPVTKPFFNRLVSVNVAARNLMSLKPGTVAKEP